MKLISLLALASVSVITANAGEAARAYYKVKINADATLQTAPGETTNAKVSTSNVIDALVDELNVQASKASDFDIIACFVGNGDQVMETATFYLARTRGATADRYKVQIPTTVFNAEGGEAVFKRAATANNSTVKVNVTDAFASLVLNTDTLSFIAEGLAKATITVKDVAEGGNPFLSAVSNNFSGHHEISTAEDDGVGGISANIAGAVKVATFDALPTVVLP